MGEEGEGAVEGLLAGSSHSPFTLDVKRNLIVTGTDIISLAMKMLGAGVCVCAHAKMMLRSLCTAVWGVSVCFCFSWQDRRSSNMNYESLQENTVNKGWDPPVVPWQ